MTLRDFEFQARGHYLLETLAEARGVVTEAARIAGISRQHFHALLTLHGVPRKRKRYGNSQWRELATCTQ